MLFYFIIQCAIFNDDEKDEKDEYEYEVTQSILFEQLYEKFGKFVFM